MTDEELIKSFVEGNEKAFVELMRKYKEPITSFSYRFLGDYDDAIDVAQETFVRVYRFAHTFQGEVKFTTWLYAIAANLSKSELKRFRRRNGVSLQKEFRQHEDSDAWDVPDESYKPDERVDRNRVSQEVQIALMKVSPSYREMVILRDIQQLTYEEIASVTETEIGTVKSRINRGRAQLQELLKGLYEEIFGTSSPMK